MSTFNVFDTHPMFKRLTNAGLTPPAAETLVEEFAHMLKSQSDTDRMNLLTENFQLRTELAQWKVDIVKWQAVTLLAIFAVAVIVVITSF